MTPRNRAAETLPERDGEKKKEIQATDRVAGRSGESETGNAINQIGLRIVKKKQKVAQARLLSMTMKIQQTQTDLLITTRGLAPIRLRPIDRKERVAGQ